MADIRVQRGVLTLSGTSQTVTLPSAVGSLSSAFVKINVSSVTGSDVLNSPNVYNNDAAVAAWLTDTQTIQFSRRTNVAQAIVAWEV